MQQVATFRKSRLIKRENLKFVLILFMIGAVGFFTAYPVGLLIVKSFQVSGPGQEVEWGLSGWRIAFGDPGGLLKIGANTFFLGSMRTGITLVLAIYFAWVVTRTNTPWRGFIEFMMWLGFFLPAIPMTLGWILLLEPSGFLNIFLEKFFGFSSPFNIYSYGGIIWAHIAFSTSIRFLLLTPAFRAMDAALEEAGRLAGNNSMGVLRRVTVPVLAPAIIIGTVLGFIKSLESLEVELLLGLPADIPVFTTKITDLIRSDLPLYGQATALSSVFLVIIFILVGLQRVLLRGRLYTTVTGKGYSVRPADIGGWKWFTFGTAMLFIVVMIFLPFAMLVTGTFMTLSGIFTIPNVWTTRHWLQAFDDPVFIRSLRNTLIMGFGASGFGALLYAFIAYMLVRGRFAGRGLLGLFVWLPWAIPGVLLSLALLWIFLGTGPFLKPVYGTIIILIIATTIGSLPLGVQILRASVMQMSPELEEAARVHGTPWHRTFTRIVLPLMAPAIMSVAIISFISAIRDVPTVVFLGTFQTRPLSLLILDYVQGGSREKAAVVGVFLSGLIIIVALIGRKLALQLGTAERR